MSKSNVSSIRYSNEVKDIIESMDGNSFSEKFHNLVEYCYNKLPELREEEKKLNKSIHDKSNQIRDLVNKVYTLKELERELYRFKDLTKKVNDEFKV